MPWRLLKNIQWFFTLTNVETPPAHCSLLYIETTYAHIHMTRVWNDIECGPGPGHFEMGLCTVPWIISREYFVVKKGIFSYLPPMFLIHVYSLKNHIWETQVSFHKQCSRYFGYSQTSVSAVGESSKLYCIWFGKRNRITRVVKPKSSELLEILYVKREWILNAFPLCLHCSEPFNQH